MVGLVQGNFAQLQSTQGTQQANNAGSIGVQQQQAQQTQQREQQALQTQADNDSNENGQALFSGSQSVFDGQQPTGNEPRGSFVDITV